MNLFQVARIFVDEDTTSVPHVFRPSGARTPPILQDGREAYEAFFGVAVDQLDGSMVLSGWFRDVVSTVPTNISVVKLDTDGGFLWEYQVEQMRRT